MTSSSKVLNSSKKINSSDRYCSYYTSKKLCDNEYCNDCFNKSFASHKKSKNWSKINNLTPRQIFLNTSKKYYFYCNYCGKIFEQSIKNIVNTKYKFCPYSCNEFMYSFYETIKNTFNDGNYIITSEFTPYDWFNKTNIDKCPYSFCLKKQKIIIEVDFNDFEKLLKLNIHKMKYANNHDYSVIRLSYIDLIFKKKCCLQKLEYYVNILSNAQYIKNIYICKGNEYNNYIFNNNCKIVHY